MSTAVARGHGGDGGGDDPSRPIPRTELHLGENFTQWSNLIGEIVREYPMYYPSWHTIEEGLGTTHDWDKQIDYWLDLKNTGRAAQMLKTGQKARDTISINEPRGTYTDADVDKIKEDNKRVRKELDLLRTVVRSDDRISQLLKQPESKHEVGGGNGSDGGGDDEGGTDEDAGADEEI
uniref:Uncharacterized protein n=1 Tax=Tanacetum cinerariifolium TaxID=118510 RepID=A0A6L2NAP8_TANCI|nr:hypothetical protein [Tanacetum cinerariifolium]